MKKPIQFILGLILPILIFNSCIKLPNISPNSTENIEVFEVNEEWKNRNFTSTYFSYDLNHDDINDIFIYFYPGYVYNANLTGSINKKFLALSYASTLTQTSTYSFNWGLRRLEYGQLGGELIPNSVWASSYSGNSDYLYFLKHNSELTYYIAFKIELSGSSDLYYGWMKVRHKDSEYGTVLQIGIAKEPNRPIKMGEK